MKILGMIVGGILLLPIAIVIVALICVTLIGGYIGIMLHLLWDVLLLIVGMIIAYKIAKYFFDR